MPREAYVFARFLRLLPRYEFQRIVDKYNGDYRIMQSIFSSSSRQKVCGVRKG